MFALAAGGLDPSGGAGLIVDVLTFSAFGLRPQAVLTASTVQSIGAVKGFMAADRAHLHEQVRLLFETLPPSVVKIGMLGGARPVHALADALESFAGDIPVVLDTVLVSTSGRPLISPEGFQAMTDRLFPLARVVTPNLPEAERLAGLRLSEGLRVEDLAERILALGPQAVIVKGGHAEGDPVDHVFEKSSHREVPGSRIPGMKIRGTGCLYASALAACLARGLALFAAAKEAKRFVTAVIASADKSAGFLQIGAIPGIWEIRGM